MLLKRMYAGSISHWYAGYDGKTNKTCGLILLLSILMCPGNGMEPDRNSGNHELRYPGIFISGYSMLVLGTGGVKGSSINQSS